jgi:hypothetical protein
MGERVARLIAGGACPALHRGALSSERVRHEARQGLHREHPRCTANPPDMVESSSSKRGRRATEGRSSPVRSMAPELNSGEGVAFLVWEAAPKLKEATDLHNGREVGEEAWHRRSGEK